MTFRLTKALALVLFLASTQLVALAGEIAVLRNGFEIPHLRREQQGDMTRLYTADGYLDIPTEQIASFERDAAPAVPARSDQDQTPIQVANSPMPSQNKPAGNATDLDEVVREASARRRIDPDFVSSVIKAESNFYPRAVSPKGAQGLMQLMPGTAALLGVTDPFDPRSNVEAGTQYLSELLDLYHDDPIKALAAYNAGPQRVEQYHGVPPYRETKLYIARIVRDFNAKKVKQKARLAAAQSQTSPTAKNGAAHANAKTAGDKASKNKVQQAALSPSQSPSGSK